tara:strand:- start:2890 stop:3483 length:594 start_codon:yes stop_codon:yes gene_type:complete
MKQHVRTQRRQHVSQIALLVVLRPTWSVKNHLLGEKKTKTVRGQRLARMHATTVVRSIWFLLLVDPRCDARTPRPVLFGTFDRVAAKGLLQRWRPQVVGKSLVSASDTLDVYVKGSIALTRANSGAIVSDAVDLFIVRTGTRTCILEHALWSADAERADTLRALRTWASQRGISVVCELDGRDASLWMEVAGDSDDP